jgi:hypothetical protein
MTQSIGCILNESPGSVKEGKKRSRKRKATKKNLRNPIQKLLFGIFSISSIILSKQDMYFRNNKTAINRLPIFLIQWKLY